MKKYLLVIALSCFLAPSILMAFDNSSLATRNVALSDKLTLGALDLYSPRLQPGSRDNSFGVGGTFDFQPEQEVDAVGHKIVRLNDGNFIVGVVENAAGPNVNLVVMSQDFAITGSLPVLSKDVSIIKSLATDGEKIYLFGENVNGDLQIRAYTKDATASSGYVLDTSFSGDGILTPAGTSGHDLIYFKSGLFAALTAGGDLKLHKFTTAGIDDADFNNGVVIDLDAVGFQDSQTRLTAYGEHVYVAASGTDGPQQEVRKFNITDGVQVTDGFGTAGVADTTLSANDYLTDDIAIDNDSGEIYVLLNNPAAQDTAVVKFTPAGVLDTAWGTNGVVTITNAQTPQKLLIKNKQVYFIGRDGDAAEAVIRLTSSGALDTNFGVGGLLVNNDTTDTNDALFIEGNAKIIVLGANNPNAALWKVNAASGTGSASDIIADNADAIAASVDSSTSGGILG
jgi:hypothetical protein